MAHGRGTKVPATGSRRQMQALVAEGFPYTYLSSQLGYANPQWLQAFCTQETAFIHSSTALPMEKLYAKLHLVTPQAVGLAQFQITRAKNVAALRGWAISMCWDEDTLNDPEAIPDWTGECGTPKGYGIHKRDNIRMCDPCRVALNLYVLEKKHARLYAAAA